MSRIINMLSYFHSCEQVCLSRKVTAKAPAYPFLLRLGFTGLGSWELRFRGTGNAWRADWRLSLRRFLGEFDVIHDLHACGSAVQELKQSSVRTGIELAGQRQGVASGYDSDSVADPRFAERAHDLLPPLGSGG